MSRSPVFELVQVLYVINTWFKFEDKNSKHAKSYHVHKESHRRRICQQICLPLVGGGGDILLAKKTGDVLHAVCRMGSIAGEILSIWYDDPGH